jgi:hypothetical protein
LSVGYVVVEGLQLVQGKLVTESAVGHGSDSYTSMEMQAAYCGVLRWSYATGPGRRSSIRELQNN